MKKLNFKEMEVDNGGIAFVSVYVVIQYLYAAGYGDQSNRIADDFMHGRIQWTGEA